MIVYWYKTLYSLFKYFLSDVLVLWDQGSGSCGGGGVVLSRGRCLISEYWCEMPCTVSLAAIDHSLWLITLIGQIVTVDLATAQPRPSLIADRLVWTTECPEMSRRGGGGGVETKCKLTGSTVGPTSDQYSEGWRSYYTGMSPALLFHRVHQQEESRAVRNEPVCRHEGFV